MHEAERRPRTPRLRTGAPPGIAGQTLALCQLRGFPNRTTDGDVLRMQSLHRARVKADDIAVASDHGRELLDYVLADLPPQQVT